MEILIQSLLEQYGAQHSGFAHLETPLSLDFYKTWLSNSFQGDMDYLAAHLPSKENPKKLMPSAQSAIVFTYSYSTPEWSHNFPLKHLKVASYAQKKDYHHWLQTKVDNMCKDLKKIFPEEEFIGFTDSAPVMERDLAHRAGLGWFGKNTCLIDKKKGSLFFIAEIYTSLNLKAPATLPLDHCGTCTRCIEACPTGAILENKTLDSKLCVSYWTIETKSIAPAPLREKFQDLFFGCDICQDVCPWNGKIPRRTKNTSPEDLTQELKWILNSSSHQLMKKLKGTPLARAGGRGLKRNALVVAGNLKIKTLRADIEPYLGDEKLGELARWSVDQMEISL